MFESTLQYRRKKLIFQSPAIKIKSNFKKQTQNILNLKIVKIRLNNPKINNSYVVLKPSFRFQNI